MRFSMLDMRLAYRRAGAGGPPQSTLLNKLVSWWNFDEQGGARYDATLTANDLTDHNGTRFVGAGPSGTYATFVKASSQFLENTNFVPDWSLGLTQAFWMRIPNTATAIEYYSIIGQYGPIWGDGGILLNDSNSSAGLLFMTVSNTTEIKSVAWTDNINDGLWHFIVIRYDPVTKQASLSVDLQPAVFTAALSAHPSTPTTYKQIRFGGNHFLGNFFDGGLSCAGVWNSHLSDLRIASLFNDGRGKRFADLTVGDKASLMSYWNMDETSGNRADSNGLKVLIDNGGCASDTNAHPANLPSIAMYAHKITNEYMQRTGVTIDFSQGATVSFWMYCVTKPSGDFQPDRFFELSDGYTNSNAFSYTNVVYDTGNIIYHSPDYNSAANDKSNSYDYAEPGSAKDDTIGKWVHVVFTFDKTLYPGRTTFMYINGRLSAQFSAVMSANPNPAAQDLDVNFTHWGDIVGYDKAMSAVGIWKRSLTPTEIGELYNSGVGNIYPFTGLP